MNIGSLFLALAIGLLFWGGWPIVANAAKGVTDPFVRAFLVNVVSAIGLLPFLPGRISASGLPAKGVLILLIGGLLNFLGHALFPRLQTAQGSHVSLYMCLIPALCILAAAVGGPIFYHDPVTVPKVLFTLLILIGAVGLAFTSLR